MNANNVNVIEVKFPPAIGKVEMMQGIRTKEAAAIWAQKRGYARVFWLKSRERVYAEKPAGSGQQSAVPQGDAISSQQKEV